MSTKSKKHHYVPQFLLRNFSLDGVGKCIFVFDKKHDRTYKSSIADAGSENHFNTVDIDGYCENFENLFEKIDNHSAGLVHQLIEERSLARLSQTDRFALVDLFAVQLLRTKLWRTSLTTLGQSMRQVVEAMGYATDNDPYYALPTDNDARLFTVQSFLKRDTNRTTLAKKHAVLFEPPNDARFHISDNPVVMTNAFPYGDVGLQAAGIQVYLPLSPTLGVAFLCPSYLKRLIVIDNPVYSIDDAHRERFRNLRDGIVNGTIVTYPAHDIHALNQLQVVTSSRYLYGATNDFELARAMLRNSPELCKVDSLFHVGKMGRGPGRRPKMPEGLHLVLLGEWDHGVLALLSVDSEGEGITALTADADGLDALMRIGTLIEARLFDDGHQTHSMREIKLEILERGASTRFRIVHRDAALRDLCATLSSKRRQQRRPG